MTPCKDHKGKRGRPEGRTHAQCRGRTATVGAIYQFKICRAILVGCRMQLKADGMRRDGYVGLPEAGQKKPAAPCDHVGYGDPLLIVEIDGGPVYWDDLTGQSLDPMLI